jgi:BMFP domain-containing protein YqiC
MKTEYRKRAEARKNFEDVWERSYNEVQILSREKFEACRRYVEQNPVEARLSATAEEYRYSSAGSSAGIDPIPVHFAKSRG